MTTNLKTELSIASAEGLNLLYEDNVIYGITVHKRKTFGSDVAYLMNDKEWHKFMYEFIRKQKLTGVILKINKFADMVDASAIIRINQGNVIVDYTLLLEKEEIERFKCLLKAQNIPYLTEVERL